MAHSCEICGQQCYCDMDDCGGLPQPEDCPHFTPGFCDDDDDDEMED